MKKVSIEKSPGFPPAAVRPFGTAAIFFSALSEVETEALRKSIHFLIALVPAIAAFNHRIVILLLVSGITAYTVMELLRLCDVKVPIVSALTGMASRPRDNGRFVLGPVTLGLGALLALLLFPLPAASIGIYTLAFGDGFASLTGKLYGRCRPAFLFGKSVEGSIACFSAVFISAWLASRSPGLSLATAFTATAVEALPLEDYDNIALPLAVGFVVQLVLR